MLDRNSSILALDMGEQRIGLAIANVVARLPNPFRTIPNNEQTMKALLQIIQEEGVAILVVGRPRGLNGQETDQTRICDSFTEELRTQLPVPVYAQDEAVTSKKAEAELKSRGRPYVKGDIDALAASYILEDFLQEHQEIRA
ncbi:MAG TPA: Holliday junction resolvase RuvX [Candidatus Saccharimonadales bacterium]|nr:Holliday junction resolvase RuvX [Candidatus Saccharimonadales bacterium]